jgi:hypothetical protein
MTTILADARLGVMVSDSRISDGQRQWLDRKVFRVRGSLIGGAGEVERIKLFVQWFKANGKLPYPKFGPETSILLLDETGLYTYEPLTGRQHVTKGYEAIGTGGMGAMCAYEALGHADPRRAVTIAVGHDANSAGPIRSYKLSVKK